MKSVFKRLIARIAATGLIAAGLVAPTLASTFGQREVRQDDFIAVATPLAIGNSYKLVVIEQISRYRDCWDTFSSNPTRVNLLLLNFDFTDICGRSTDSNGYSIRAAGQDIGMRYRLRLQKRGNEVVLLGRSFDGTEFEIGSTNGLVEGPMKIHLDPQWRFTKRIYQGEATGHIYFTTDRPRSTLIGKP
jgi:N-acetylmuramoyl-L-alanine amidase